MASLYKQAQSRNWTMLLTDEHGRRVRRSTRTANKAAAQMMLAEEQRAVELRRLRIAAPSPLSARTPIALVIERHLRDCTDGYGLSEAWVRQKRYRLAKVVAWTGIETIAGITPALVRGLLDEQLAAMSAETRKQYVSILRELCGWAMEQHPPMLGDNPVTGVMPRRRSKHGEKRCRPRDVRRCLWTHEIPMLLGAEPDDACSRTHWNNRRRPLYIVALRTGFRRSTLEQITPSMIRLDCANPRFEIPAELMKSRRRFTMPIVDQAVIENIELLLRVCSARRPMTRGRVNRWVDRPLGPVPNNEKTFTSDLVRAGIPKVDGDGMKVVFHSLRATFATQLALSGSSLLETKELMDHTRIETTERYYLMVGVDTRRASMRRLPGMDEDALREAVRGMAQTMAVG